MTKLFDIAACRALQMSQPPSPKISIDIEIGQPSMNSGLSSIQKRMNIGGEPHRLSYINSDEASLLRQLGGSGQPVNGVPAYNGMGIGDPDAPSGDPATTDVDEPGGYTGAVKEGMSKEEADQAQRDAALADYMSSTQAYDTTSQDIEEAKSVVDRIVDWYNRNKRGLEKGVLEFGKKQVKEFGFDLSGAIAIAMGVNPYAAGLLTVAAPHVAKALGVQTKEEQEEAVKEKYGVNSPEHKALQKQNEDFEKEEKETAARAQEADTGLGSLKEEMKERDTGVATEEDEGSAMQKYLKDRGTRPPIDADRAREEWYENLPDYLKRIFDDVYGEGGIPTTLFPDYGKDIVNGNRT